MLRYLLAGLAALAVAGTAGADYVLLVVNLNARPAAEDGTGGPPGAGMVGGPPPMGSGGDIGRGQMTPPMGGRNMVGGPPPMGGDIGSGPGRGSMIGSGGFVGAMAGPAAPEEIDDSPDLVVAVLEVKPIGAAVKTFNKGGGGRFKHKWGGDVVLYAKTPVYEAILLEKSRGVPVATVSDRFAADYKEVFKEKEKPSVEAVLALARWALEHGLPDECAKVLDQVVGSEKAHPAVAAYAKVKQQLAEPLAKEDLSAKWKNRPVDGYKVSQTDKHHFALIHSGVQEDHTAELDRLERTFRGFYYWWALRGVALPVPKQRQLAVEAERSEDFKKMQAALTASPVLADSFSARREGLAVTSARRNDLVYDKLDKAAKPLKDNGFSFDELLKGSGSMPSGVPKDIAQQLKLRRAVGLADDAGAALAGFRTTAVLLKALEHEWEQTSVTHEASRQMLFASKLLPRNVNAPEWVQFGMGSFFETPLQSPWPSVGAPNPYWMPRFKELNKAGKYEKTPLETMKKVVTDAYFRERPTGDKPDEIAASKSANLRKARAAAWALTYFLARSEQHLPRLQRYFKELSKMPRDVELDEKALWACFEKAFAGEVLSALANRWVTYINNEKLDAAAIHEKIREFHAKMNAPQSKAPGNPASGPGGPPPGSQP